jgi:hypothetical protein
MTASKRTSPEDPPFCPQCGKSDRVVRVVYGMPAYEAFEAEQRGELVLGGCCVSAGDPTHHCLRCGLGIGAREPDEWERALESSGPVKESSGPIEVKLYEMPEDLTSLSDVDRRKLATSIWEDLTGKKASD